MNLNFLALMSNPTAEKKIPHQLFQHLRLSMSHKAVIIYHL